MMFYDVVLKGKIVKTVTVPIETDVAKLTQLLSEMMGVNIKSIHLCNLRFLSQGMSALTQ